MSKKVAPDEMPTVRLTAIGASSGDSSVLLMAESVRVADPFANSCANQVCIPSMASADSRYSVAGDVVLCSEESAVTMIGANSDMEFLDVTTVLFSTVWVTFSTRLPLMI